MVIPQQYFIFISIFIGIIYLSMIITGYKNGFFYELVSLLYTVAAVAISWFASPVLADLFPLFDLGQLNNDYSRLAEFLHLNKVLNTVVYFIIVFLILKLLYLLVSLLTKSLNRIPVLGSFNQLLGAAAGFINGTIIVLALSMLLSTPVVRNGNQVREGTILKYIRKYSDDALGYVIDAYSDSRLKESVDDIDIGKYREEFKQWLVKVSKTDE